MIKFVRCLVLCQNGRCNPNGGIAMKNSAKDLLRRACVEFMEEFLSTLPQEEELNQDVSAEMTEKIFSDVGLEVCHKEKKRSVSNKTVFLLAAIIVAVTVLITVFAVSVSREKLGNYAVEKGMGYVSVFSDMTGHATAPPVDDGNREEIYVPQGFSVIESIEANDFFHTQYRRGDELLSVVIAPCDSLSAVYDASSDISTKDFGNTEICVWQGENNTFAVFESNNKICQIYGNLSSEEILNIAKQMKL